MLRTKPRLRIVGQGARLRVRQRGDWAVDVATSLSEPCRASIAIEKALAEAIVRARGSGMTWNKIGAVLGATDHADSKEQLVDALADHRRAVLQHLLRETR
jgi:hypothetical protein